jgi:uncharacterized protein with LGFP repeats
MSSFDAAHEPANPINSVYLAYGGAAGVLGLPAGDEEDTACARSPGRRRHYAGSVHGPAHGTSAATDPTRMVSCNRPASANEVVESTISWSARTGAHVVHGQIRELWLQMGAESGELGYPICSEEPTPDGRGRQSRFEFGGITWYPESGPIVSVSRPPDPEDPDRKASTEEQRLC